MNALVPLTGGHMPVAFASRASELPDLNAAAAANLAASFGVVSIRGKNWRLRYKGDEELLMDERGVPVPTIPVVILGISDVLSRTYYEKGFTDGDAETPD